MLRLNSAATGSLTWRTHRMGLKGNMDLEEEMEETWILFMYSEVSEGEGTAERQECTTVSSSHLLEANIHLKRKQLSRATDWRDTELLVQ